MKKVLSIALFLAAAGIGFTLLPSCGGGAGNNDSAIGVVTVNDIKKGRKFIRVYMNGTWMDIKPEPTGENNDTPETNNDDIANVPCQLYLGPISGASSNSAGWDGRILQYTTAHVNDDGIPDSASFSLAIDNQVFQNFMDPANLPWQLFMNVGTNGSMYDAWVLFCSNLEFTIESFQAQSGRVTYTVEWMDKTTTDYDKQVYIEVYKSR